MHSRAHLIIERDAEKLNKEKPWGISAHPLKEENMFEWTAKILGLQGSTWEGGIFRLYLKFSEQYNNRPPEVCFHTVPFHPNVDMITGKPCVDFLDNWNCWRTTYDLTYILMTLQMLLSNPVLDNAVNMEAVQMLRCSPHTYKQMVRDCVAASQRVEVGMMPHAELKIPQTYSKEPSVKYDPPKTTPTRVSKLSFADYHSTWSGIATSKVQTDAKNPLHEVLRQRPDLQATHYGLPVEEMQLQMERQFQEHNTLMYGKFRPKPSNEETQQAKLDHLQKMRKIYLQPRTSHRTTPVPISARGLKETSLLGSHTQAVEDGDEEEEMWGKEVDDLVAWSTKLDDHAL